MNMKDKKIIAVGAGRYHSAVCTEHEVFTFGKNLGQLGMYMHVIFTFSLPIYVYYKKTCDCMGLNNLHKI